MKTFLLLLVLGCASSDKLDLTYLPPPGSQHAGGRPEDIQIPLEYPKETYSTTLRPQGNLIGQGIKPDDYQATIGINRIPPSQFQSGSIPSSGVPINNFQKTPTTTVSYAFTQTTTHPPSEGYETTIAPLNPVTGLPVTTPAFNDFYSQQPNLVYDGNKNTLPGVSGFQQTVNQYGHPTIAPTPGSNRFPGSSLQHVGQTVFNQNQPGPQLANFYGPQQFDQQSGEGVPEFISQSPYGQNQQTNQIFTGNNGYGQPGFVTSTSAPQIIGSSPRPGVTAGYGGEKVPGYTTSAPNIPGFNGQRYRPGTTVGSSQAPMIENEYLNTGSRLPSQQFPGSYSEDNNIGQPSSGGSLAGYNPSSTATPTISTPGFPQRQGLSPTNYPSTFSPTYPFDDRAKLEGVNYNNRPERPQAESDRNAVILNYDNVITPDGYFAYSYDTSNGIHADESGTANDGVKAKGSYSYTGDDGKLYTIEYTADENGFRPRGEHLPTPPPVPEAIQKIIEKVKQEKQAGISHDGFYDENKYGDKKYLQTKDNVPSFESQPGRQKPQSSSRRPIIGKNDGYEEQEDIENDQVTANRNAEQPVQNKSPRPINRIPQNGGDLNSFGGVEEGVNEKSFNKGTTRQPVLAQNAFENADINSPFDEEGQEKIDDVRRRPGSTTLSPKYTTQNEQVTDDYTENEDTVSNNQNRRPTGSRPIYQQGSDAEQAGLPIDSDNRVRRPVVKGSVKRPGGNFNIENNGPNRQTTLEKVERVSQQPMSKHFSRRPMNQQMYEERRQYDYEDSEGTKVYPSQTEGNHYTSGVTDFENQQPQGVLTGSDNRPVSKATPIEQIISTRRRPFRPGLKVNESNINEHNTYLPGPNYNAAKLDSTPTKSYSGVHPSLTSERFDQGSNEYFPENQELAMATNRPKSSKVNNTGTRGRPQISTLDESIRDLEDRRLSIPSTKYGQKIATSPKFIQRTGTQQAKNIVTPLNETGYQYIPPQTKFSQDEVSKYSTRFPGTSILKPYYEGKGTTAKPFLTPNVHRVSESTFEEQHNVEEPIHERLPSRTQETYNDGYHGGNDQQYPESRPSDQQFGDETGSSPQQPSHSTTISSTYRPVYNKNTGRPHYSQTAGYETTPQGTVTVKPYSMPVHHGYDKNEFSTRESYNNIPSTTQMPSRRPYFGSTDRTKAPGKETNYSLDRSNQNKPGYILDSSTTPLPSPRPTSDDYYPQNINSQYQTTYRPMETIRPTTEYYDGTTRLPNVGPTGSGLSSQAPYGTKLYGNELPSTTYRPNYKPGGIYEPTTARPRVQVDGFGRPISGSQDLGNQQYSEYSPVRGDENRGTVQNLDVQFPQRVQGSRRPGTVPNKGDKVFIQPSTERIIGEDFSGPKQPQRFDPETGYHY